MSVKDYPSQESYGRRGYVVLNASMAEQLPEPLELRHDQYLIIRDCPLCGKEAQMIVPAQGLWDWEHGAFIQNAMPDLSAEEREMIMTGYHPQCWDQAIPEEEY